MARPPLLFGRVTLGHATRQWPPEKASLLPRQRNRRIILTIVDIIHFGKRKACVWCSEEAFSTELVRVARLGSERCLPCHFSHHF
jgi:hypothetical protein